jgi:hypothetical protein
LGIATELAEKRKSFMARLSTTARIMAFPDEHRLKIDLQEQVRIAKEKCSALEDKVRVLQADNKELRERLRGSFRETVTVRQVTSAYLEMLATLGVTLDGQPWTVEMINCKRRSQPYAQVRHVLMNLCRLLTRQSYPSIAKTLGGRDHTSVMHAVRRTPDILQKRPDLRQAHDFLLAKYKPAQPAVQEAA